MNKNFLITDYTPTKHGLPENEQIVHTVVYDPFFGPTQKVKGYRNNNLWYTEKGTRMLVVPTHWKPL